MNKELIKKLAGILKVSDTDLTAAIEKEDGTIELPELHTFTPDELTTRDTAQQGIGKKEGLSEGKDIGKELAVKDIKKAFNLEFEGKDINKLVEAAKTEFAKGDDGLKQQVQILQTRLGEKENEITNLNKAADGAKQDAQILAAFPKSRKSLLTDTEYLTLVKSTLQIEHDNGQVTVKRNGEILRDPKSTNPLALDAAINTVFTERGWNEAEPPAPPKGRGGGNTPPGVKPTKMSEAVEQFEAAGKGIGGVEFQQYVSQLAKENADFDFSG